MKKGLTLVEMLVVVAIIMVLGAITFALMAPMRGEARKKVCASNMRQIHLAAHLYSNDNDGGGNPELGGLVYVPMAYEMRKGRMVLMPNLEPYGYSQSIAFCPSSTPKFRSGNNLGYTMKFVGLPDLDQGYSSKRQRNLKDYEKYGEDFHVVTCATHDALENLPKVPKKDWFKRKEWIQYINVSGALRTGWRQAHISSTIYELSF